MRRGILIGTVWALVAALAAHAAESDEYVVYVPELDLRDNPKVEEKVLTVLKRGTPVRDVYGEVLDLKDSWDEYDFWREVEADGTVGWVSDNGIISANMYEAFREADKRGRAGDGEGMLRALDKAVNDYRPRIEKGWGDRERPRIEDLDTEDIWRQYVSPDGSKVVVVGEWPRIDWGGCYPFFGRIGTGVPVLYFENGKGLVKRFRCMEEIIGKWSPDSRYFAYPNTTVIEFTFEMPFALLDANNWEGRIIGDIVTTGDWFEYEFVDGYVIWMGRELVTERPSFLEKESYSYVMWAYDLKTGDKVRVLETDIKTIDTEKRGGKYGLKLYKAQMVPAGAIPAVIGDSVLYKKYENEYSECIEDVTHWME